MKKYIAFIIIVIMAFIGIFYFQNKLNLYTKNFYYMDTYINVKLYVKDKKEAENLFSKIDMIYNKYHKMTNLYDEASELNYINNNNSENELTVSDDLYDMLQMSNEWYEKSKGKFNVNMGTVIKVWKNYRDNKNGLPTDEELSSVYQKEKEIILLENNKIKNNGLNIDLGAVSKGYATQKAADMLLENGVKNFIIDAGGNVLVGEAYKKEYFTIGIKNPEVKNEIYQIVKGNNISVVTSGGYERFYEYEGVRYHHIIDPDTLYPANNMLSVTVIADDSALADILSTTLFLLPLDEGLKLINQLENVEAIFYIASDNIIKSEGFKKYE